MAFHDLLDSTPQVLEAHYITGEDCFLLKLIARSMPDLEQLTGKFLPFGQVTTNLTYSSPVRDRPRSGRSAVRHERASSG